MDTRKPVPELEGFDHTRAFLKEGYTFISRCCDQFGTDAVRARLLMKPVLLVRGESAARMFYSDRFTRRKGAMPSTVLRLLQDRGSVQQLDGTAHRHRKSLFIDLLTNAHAEHEFLELFRREWLHSLHEWSKRDSIVLFDEVNLILTRAICRWVGLPLEKKADVAMAKELSSMIENAGRFGPAVIAALWRRRGTERYIRSILKRMRGRPDELTDSLPISQIANFCDIDRKRLSLEVATVEVLNILRPTVAIGRYIMFAAMALHEFPDWRAALRETDDHQYEYFAEEVRRLYPFFPVIGGIARESFLWEGIHIAKGDWVLLDLYGTTHDPRLFPRPDAFDPERRLSWQDQDFRHIPQGAGDARETHRCPGERFTVATMREAIRLLVDEMEYTVPPQDLSMPLNHMPARPKSGMVLAGIRHKPVE